MNHVSSLCVLFILGLLFGSTLCGQNGVSPNTSRQSTGTSRVVSPIPGPFASYRPTQSKILGRPLEVPKPVVKIPKSTYHHGPASFYLGQIKEELVLSFYSKDPRYALSHSRPFVVELVPEYPLKTFPKLIINRHFKGAKSIKIKTNQINKKKYPFIKVFVSAFFYYCDIKTGKDCKSELSKMTYVYQL